ncbi:ATP-grasp domain-containing protein [Micromonospora sp. NPDC051925]|uniref:ATP-grasp domain-containing protein n=1 Tax=Micromonospora sp. NPDC051925 TaxID=3364288 RepID=UPI0037CA730A
MSGDRPILLLLSASRRVIVKARALGLDVVHVEAPTMSDPGLRELCRESLVADLLDVPGIVELARSLHRRYGFAGVTSNHEPACPAAEAVARDLGLLAAGTGVTTLLRDKIATRARLAGDPDLDSPWAEIRDAGDVPAAARVVGYPMIIKPGSGSASLGIIRVDGPDDLDEAARQVRRMARNEHRYHELLPVTRFLAEPLVAGDEYSVETFSRAGRHEIQAVVRKITSSVSFVELGHLTPAELDPALRTAVGDRVRAFLDRVGLREGPAHTEVITGDAGPHVIESHARTGGDGIPELVQLVSGRDPEAEMLAHFAGVRPPAPVPAVARATAKVYLTAAGTGRIRAVDGEAEARAVPGVHAVELYAGPGDQAGPLTASWDRLGALVATAETVAQAWGIAQHAASLIKIHLEEA